MTTQNQERGRWTSLVQAEIGALRARAQLGDRTAVDEFIRRFGSQLNRIVRRELRSRTGGKAVCRMIAVHERDAGNAKESDSGHLVNQVVRDLAAAIIEGPAEAHAEQMIDTLLMSHF